MVQPYLLIHSTCTLSHCPEHIANYLSLETWFVFLGTVLSGQPDVVVQHKHSVDSEAFWSLVSHSITVGLCANVLCSGSDDTFLTLE